MRPRRPASQHVIWSTLEDTRALPSAGRRAHADSDGQVQRAALRREGRGQPFFTERVPTTLLNTSFYWDNLIYFGMGPKKGADGKLAFTLPMGDKKLPGIAAEDIGKCAYGIFKDGDGGHRQDLGIAGEHLTGAQMAAGADEGARPAGQLQRGHARQLPRLRLSRAPTTLATCSSSRREFESYFCGARPLDVARRLNPELQTFAAFLARNKDRIPLE